MRSSAHLKALIICVVKKDRGNKCGLFQKQFIKIPLKTYFHICFGSDELWWWWLYHQEIILGIHLQILPSKIPCKMSWSIVCRGQWLETASEKPPVGNCLAMEHGLHMINLLKALKKALLLHCDSDECIV